MKVLANWFATEEELATIRAGLPKGTEVVLPKGKPRMSRFEVSHKDCIDQAVDADAIMAFVCPRSVFVEAEKLKALVWMHAGCDELDYELLKNKQVQVANTRGANAIAVTEQAMNLLLAVAKRTAERHQWVQEAHWQPIFNPDYMAVPLWGSTLAVIGYGEIGSRIAKRAKAFDMTVLGVRRHPEKGDSGHADEVHGMDKLKEVLGRADFTVIALPITRETDHIFDEEVLSWMKPGSRLVNIARGNIIVENALADALDSGHIAGYAADVWWNYTESFPASYHFPIPSRFGIHKRPNVVASGDQASNCHGVIPRHLASATESIAAFIEGKPMPRKIDLDLGY
jgi:phosphoglycerate dehydrogenase-like enzyme